MSTAFSLSSELSLWLLPICLLFGISAAYLLYHFRSSNVELSVPLKRLLQVIRALYLSLVAFLLLSPFIRSSEEQIEKPIIIYGEDHSQSIGNLTDSINLSEFLSKRNSFLEKATEKFDVLSFAYGDSIAALETVAGFDHKTTNFSAFLDQMESRHRNRNVAFMLLSSDGLYNQGVNPLYRKTNYPFEIHTLALGDTALTKDSRIVKINANKIAFLDNTFEVEVEVGADLLKGEELNLSVLQDGDELASSTVSIANDPFRQKFKFEIRATNTGIQKYDVKLSGSKQEGSLFNNERSFYVDVLEGQQKVLLLAQSPHPDVKAIQLSINRAKRFQASFSLERNFRGNIDDYDLIILHQLPGKNSSALVDRVINGKQPLLVVLGAQSSIGRFNELGLGVQLTKFKRQYAEAISRSNTGFQLFSVNGEQMDEFKKYPPMTTALATYVQSGNFNVMLYQDIGGIETNYPLIGFSDRAERRTGVIFGEGLWKWKLNDYQVNGSGDQFDALMQKFVQYLASKEDRSRFRVTGTTSYFENDNIEFEAEYYDKAYQLNNAFPVKFNLTHPDGRSYDFEFLASGNTYNLDLGKLPVGSYQWKARLEDGSDVHERKGAFSVKELQIEYTASRANPDLMYNLAERHGGQMIFPDEFEQFTDELIEGDQYKAVIQLKEINESLISKKLLFFILLFLLSAEWFIRKWKGLI